MEKLISVPVIKELLKNSLQAFTELEQTFFLIPETSCERRALCCSLLPEITLVEALSAIQRITGLTDKRRKKLLKKIVYYFLMNPVEILSCPFLDNRDCVIYSRRFFGCRAYGLWSKEYYKELSEKSRQTKTFVRKQWENLGVILPVDVMDFQVPYCSHVKIKNNRKIDDGKLLNIAQTIESISQRLSKSHQLFQQLYFSDMSFLLTSMIFGLQESVRLKFSLVSDIVKTGNKKNFESIMKNIPDIFHDLTF
jgi:Fe-S-cluster containining protein